MARKKLIKMRIFDRMADVEGTPGYVPGQNGDDGDWEEFPWETSCDNRQTVSWPWSG